jgi:DNA topoisomerase-1
VAAPTPTTQFTVSEPFTTTRRRPNRPLPNLCEVTDPVETARVAGLRYVTDQTRGIRRLKAGRGFRYVDAEGEPVRDPDDLARIKVLAIPPAWTDVWICSQADGHLQATGRDDRGRKQYRYHPRWREVRDETKYGRMLEFGRALPAIRARVDDDLAKSGLPREKVLAAVVQLLERTLIRVGNEEYARANDSFGLTTLRDEHVKLSTNGVRFTFRGKGGKEHEVDLHDGRLARIVKRSRDLPGQDLFQYLDAEGVAHSIGSTDVNNYLREVTGAEFTAKDFRTWFGTVLAAAELLRCERVDTEQERKHQIVTTIEAVAERLGNTPAICRKCYVHPAVLEAFEDGQLFAIAEKRSPSDDESMEHLVLKLLEASNGGLP